MKNLLNKIIEKLRSMGEENGDDEFIDEIDKLVSSGDYKVWTFSSCI